MPFEFKLPDVGEGVTEGEIVAWHIKPGDTIIEDETMVEVMTDKATVTIPSPVTGTVLETRGGVGDIVPVHSVLVVIDTDGSGAAAAPAAEKKTEKPTSELGVVAPAPKPKIPAPAPAPKPMAAPAPAAPAPSNGQGETARVLAAPATRRVAREMGIDLATVPGTGKDGRVTKEDVLHAASDGPADAAPTTVVPRAPVTEVLRGLPPASPRPVVAPKPSPAAPTAAPPRAVSPGTETRVPIRGLRRRISQKMAESWSLVPHFTFVEEADVTRLVALRARMNETLQDEGVRLSYLPFIIKAVVAGLRRHPEINSRTDEGADELIQYGSVHLGIATATERGLMVPVLRGADQLSLRELGVEVTRLAEATRNGTATSEELSGSTFTITSLGAQGGMFATPIVNHPEVGIMGVHRIKRRPWVVDGDRIEPRDIMILSGSFDHRTIDGHIGAAFLYDVIRYLEDPDLLLLELI